MATRAKSNSRAKTTSRKQLRATYQKFLAESSPARKNKAGQDLIRAIFGARALGTVTHFRARPSMQGC